MAQGSASCRHYGTDFSFECFWLSESCGIADLWHVGMAEIIQRLLINKPTSTSPGPFYVLWFFTLLGSFWVTIRAWAQLRTLCFFCFQSVYTLTRRSHGAVTELQYAGWKMEA